MMMIKKLPLLALAFLGLWGGKVQSQCAYTTQPDPTTGIDATCWRYPICQRADGNARPCDTTNRATSPHLYLSTRQVGGIEQKMRSFLKFDMTHFGKVATSCLPTSATLDLYYYRNSVAGDEHVNSGSGTGNSFYIQRVIEDWKEDTIRWMYPVSSGNLRMPEVSQGTDPKNRILVNASTNDTQDYTIDLSEMVKFWFENPDSNFGVRLMLVEENLGNQVHLTSSNYPDAQFRPKLSIDFPCTEAFAGNDTIACAGDQFRFSAQGGASYTWTPGDGSNDLLNRYDIYNPIFEPKKNQFFIVETRIGNCTSQDQIQITLEQRGPANIYSNDTFLCAGDSMRLTAVGGTNFKWYPEEGLSQTNITSIYAKPSETTKYFVEIKSGNETCPGLDSITIEVRPNAEAALTFTDYDLCKGDSVQLEASGGSLFRWTPETGLSNPNIANPYARPDDTTTYTVEVNSPGGCPDFTSVTINVSEGGLADAGEDVTICEGEVTTLTAIGDGTVLWTPNTGLADAFERSTAASPTVTTLYYLTITGTGTSCLGKDSVLVTVNDRPEVAVSPQDTLACLDRDLTLVATGATSYFWSNDDISDKTIVKPEEDMTIRVVGYNGDCYSDTVIANIATQKCTGELVEAPKYFTPNNDGYNDTWVIKYLDRFADNEVIIINKWGDIVYSKAPYLNNWDGTYNGQPVADDTYMYQIKVTFEGEEKVYKGTLTIFR